MVQLKDLCRNRLEANKNLISLLKMITIITPQEQQQINQKMQELEQKLRSVLNHPEFSSLSNMNKAVVLLDLENEGEYDPLGWLTWMGSRQKLPFIHLLMNNNECTENDYCWF